ncbi:MAG: hypothetical protein AABY18_05525 [Candidatus Thermoplasmatota archaeon]
MNVQPKPSTKPSFDDCMPAGRLATSERPCATATTNACGRGRVPVAGPRLLFTWPVEFEVEPWRP